MEIERVLQLPRPVQPRQVEIGGMKIEQAADEKRVVGRKAVNRRRPVTITAP
jgi:hypothetical protein